MLQTLKAVKGLIYVRTLLKKIEVHKELFLLDIEDGQETIIPHTLS